MDWYPFYPALYRLHTMHLTAEQDGIYRRLIDHYMETRQPLPDSDFALARIAGVDLSCFKHASSILRAFFRQNNGVLNHDKCDEILDEQDARSKFYAKRAKKAASVRHAKTKDLCLKHAISSSEAMLGDATVNNNSNSKEKDKTKVLSKKITLEELSVDHIAQWLMEKRTIGKYLTHDEHYILERFKDYCRSKGKRYNDYVAAYRNAFEWDTCQPKPKGTDPASKAFTAAQSIIAKRNAAAGIGGSAEPVNPAFATSLRLPENIR